MKQIILVLLTVMSFPTLTFADYINPPAGPYRSLDEFNRFDLSAEELNNLESNTKKKTTDTAQINNEMQGNNQESKTEWNNQRRNNMQPRSNQPINQQAQQWGEPSFNQQDVPAWVKQRQYEMNMRNQQFQAQQQAQFEGRNKRPAWDRNLPVKPETSDAQKQTDQNTQAQQYFPSARGQVYGPEAIPPSYYMQQQQAPQQPAYHARRPMPQYQPRWQ